MDGGLVLGLAVRVATERDNMRVREIRCLLAARLQRTHPPGHADRWLSAAAARLRFTATVIANPPWAAPRLRMNPDSSRPGDLRPRRRVGPVLAG